MRYLFLTFILLLALGFTACSFSTAFVVVNEAEHPVQVMYKTSREPSLTLGLLPVATIAS